MHVVVSQVQNQEEDREQRRDDQQGLLFHRGFREGERRASEAHSMGFQYRALPFGVSVARDSAKDRYRAGDDQTAVVLAGIALAGTHWHKAALMPRHDAEPS